MPAPPCMDAAVPDDTAYDQLQLLCLRESGAATELLKGTRALNLRTPELSALAADMLEAQRVFVCALGRWTEHTAGPAARRLAGTLGALRGARRGGAARPRPALGRRRHGPLGGRRRRGDAAAAAGARAAALVRRSTPSTSSSQTSPTTSRAPCAGRRGGHRSTRSAAPCRSAPRPSTRASRPRGPWRNSSSTPSVRRTVEDICNIHL